MPEAEGAEGVNGGNLVSLFRFAPTTGLQKPPP